MLAVSVSPATGRAYGVARVCRIWEVPRSSFHLARRLAQGPPSVRPKGRRGPKPSISDAALLDTIRADLAGSPWSGEGHRKVWARLHVRDGLRVARKRVLRLMREHNLLSPHRPRSRPASEHDRKIVTDAPNVTWATDGNQVTTVRDGKVWLFATVEHWNAEAVGWHASQVRHLCRNLEGLRLCRLRHRRLRPQDRGLAREHLGACGFRPRCPGAVGA